MIKMDIIKYRRWYLSLFNNRFDKIMYKVESKYQWFKSCGISNHPLVLSRKAFWVTGSTLCVGYCLCSDPTIYRPVFSHKRQRLIDVLHFNLEKETSEFWRRIRRRYWYCLCKLRVPIECVDCIVRFIY